MSDQAADISRPVELRDPAGAAETHAVRSSVMQLAIREKSALSAAYMPFLANGGLFIPTTRPGRLGDQIYLILSLMDDPARITITGQIVWITPPGTPGRQQGLGIHFSGDDAGSQARARIENQIGGAMKSLRQTHTI